MIEFARRSIPPLMALLVGGFYTAIIIKPAIAAECWGGLRTIAAFIRWLGPYGGGS